MSVCYVFGGNRPTHLTNLNVNNVVHTPGGVLVKNPHDPRDQFLIPSKSKDDAHDSGVDYYNIFNVYYKWVLSKKFQGNVVPFFQQPSEDDLGFIGERLGFEQVWSLTQDCFVDFLQARICVKSLFLQEHIQGLRQLFLMFSRDLCA